MKSINLAEGNCHTAMTARRSAMEIRVGYFAGFNYVSLGITAALTGSKK
jgi:hypothetical protein